MYEHVFINVEDLTSEQELILISRIPKLYRLQIKTHKVKQYAIDLESLSYYHTLDYMVEVAGWVRAKTFEEFEQLILEYQLTH